MRMVPIEAWHAATHSGRSVPDRTRLYEFREKAVPPTNLCRPPKTCLQIIAGTVVYDLTAMRQGTALESIFGSRHLKSSFHHHFPASCRLHTAAKRLHFSFGVTCSFKTTYARNRSLFTKLGEKHWLNIADFVRYNYAFVQE